MGNLERQLLASAQEGSTGSGNAIGDHLMAKLKTGEADPKLVTEGIRQEMGLPSKPEEGEVGNPHHKERNNKDNRNHKGNGRKADRTTLSLELVEIKKIHDRIKRDLDRFEEDTKMANQEISEIKGRIKEADDAGDTSAVKNWGIRLKNAEGLLKMLEKTAPSVDPMSDTAIRKQLHEYRRARDLQTHAELKGDNGEYVRQQALAVSIRENIEKLLKERGENPAVFDPVRDESIGNIRTEAMEEVSALPPEILPEERLILVPEGSSVGSPELPPQESQIEGIEQGTTSPEDERINTTVDALAELAHENVPPTPEEAPQSMAIKDWQEEAVRNFESMGGKVLDADLEHTAEEHDAVLPVLTEVVDETVGTPREGQKSAFEKFELLSDTAKLNLTPEQTELVKQLENNIIKANKETEARANETGAGEKIFDMMRFAGKEYSKLSLKTKLAVSLTLFAVAGVTGGTIASVVIGGSVFQRVLGGLATFVGVEGLLKASAEKGGRERGEWEKRRQTTIALVAGFIVGGGVIGHAIQNLSHEAVSSLGSIEAEIAQGKANLAATEHLNATNVPVEGGEEAAAENMKQFVQVAEAGDSRWSLTERVLAKGPYRDLFNAIQSDEQRTYIIDALKNRLTAGMTEEQANTLNIGDKIDFQNIFYFCPFLGFYAFSCCWVEYPTGFSPRAHHFIFWRKV